MKKLVKIGSMLTMAGVVLLSSGCACNLKQGKVNERAQALMESDLDYGNDFTLTYKITTTQKQEDGSNSIVELTHTMKRIAASNSFEFTSVAKKGSKADELQEDADNSQTVAMYVDAGVVKVKVGETVNDTTYLIPFNALQNTSHLVEEEMIKYDYYNIFINTFANYKLTPYHGCSESGDKDLLPEAVGAFNHSETKCKATKKIFGKDATYDVSYRVSISELRNVVVKTDKDNKLVSVVENNTIAVPSQNPKYETIEFTLA